MSQLEQIVKGALGASILRNSGKIKEERGIAVWKSLERTYKRKVEDLEYKVDMLKDQQSAMLDMSPTNAQSLMLAKEVDPEEFYKADNALTLEIRTAKIELEEAQGRYKTLFVNAEAETTE